MPQAVEDSDLPQPSSDWSHIQETINILCLAVCQIETTMVDSNNSVDIFTTAFTTLVAHTNAVSTQIQALENSADLAAIKDDLSSTAVEMQDNINQSIQAFQFYDRVCQRLDKIARGLENVTALMGNEDQVFDPAEWIKLQERIKNSYTLEAERIMFQHIMRGGTVTDALQLYRNTPENRAPDQDNGDVEFF